MRFGDLIHGVVAKIAKDGSGLVPREIGKPYSVRGTIPGETVEASVMKRTPEVIRTQLTRVLEPSSDRVTPRCPFAGTCGGCKWQHVDYPRQLLFKQELIRDAFTRAELPCPIDSVEGCPEIFYYRNRMDYVFGVDGELGLKQPDRWWGVVDLSTCFLLSPETEEILNRVRTWTKESGLPFWNNKTQHGFFRYLVIREGKNTGERMLTLVTSAPIDGFNPASFMACVDDLATSIVWGINSTVTDLSSAEELRLLKGNPWIYEEINGVRYKITPNAFFQTNSIMAAKLQDAVMASIPTHAKTILDLYCGSGFFSLALAKRMPDARIVGIELDAEAIAAAQENAVDNGVSVEYFVSKAEEFDWSGYAPDVVILDPPRAGMHPQSIETILEVRPERLVYVSCSIERFVKEWAGLLGHPGLSTAYRIASARALDLFPHTPHVECVFELERI